MVHSVKKRFRIRVKALGGIDFGIDMKECYLMIKTLSTQLYDTRKIQVQKTCELKLSVKTYLLVIHRRGRLIYFN